MRTLTKRSQWLLSPEGIKWAFIDNINLHDILNGIIWFLSGVVFTYLVLVKGYQSLKLHSKKELLTRGLLPELQREFKNENVCDVSV